MYICIYLVCMYIYIYNPTIFPLIYSDSLQPAFYSHPRHMVTPTASTRLVLRGISLQVPPWPMASQLATISFSSWGGEKNVPFRNGWFNLIHMIYGHF